ncbi:hypothetical protein Tco_0132734 [Tanacetum coccineum]
MTHPHSNRRFVPQAVLTRFGKINIAGARVNTAVRPVNTAGSKPTILLHTTARDRALVSENKGKGANVVKASACWVWKAKNSSNPQQKEYRKKGVFDSGCYRHMTGNKCYLTEYEDYDGGFVSFGDGKGRISEYPLLKQNMLLLQIVVDSTLFEGMRGVANYVNQSIRTMAFLYLYRPSQPIPKTLKSSTSPRFKSRINTLPMANSNYTPPPPALTWLKNSTRNCKCAKPHRWIDVSHSDPTSPKSSTNGSRLTPS